MLEGVEAAVRRRDRELTDRHRALAGAGRELHRPRLSLHFYSVSTAAQSSVTEVGTAGDAALHGGPAGDAGAGLPLRQGRQSRLQHLLGPIWWLLPASHPAARALASNMVVGAKQIYNGWEAKLWWKAK